VVWQGTSDVSWWQSIPSKSVIHAWVQTLRRAQHVLTQLENEYDHSVLNDTVQIMSRSLQYEYESTDGMYISY